MFKLFKKDKKEAIVATIEKIHHEFDTASEKLVQEAKSILAGDYIVDKADRLRSLGFRQASPVVKSIDITQKRQLADKVGYYQIHYPNNKFITEEMVKEICEKYGLLCGDVNAYIGDVPEKNLKEIESFQLRKEEMIVKTNISGYHDRLLGLAAQAAMAQRLFNQQNLTQPIYEEPRPSELKERHIKPNFKICAPEKDFDTRYMVKKGYKLEYDPIVLQPVPEGYLIVTKWGLEGEDQSLINETHN